jgi:hypothetical protein
MFSVSYLKSPRNETLASGAGRPMLLCVKPIALTLVLVASLSTACAPRLYLRHETPPALNAGGVTVVTVQGVTPQSGPNVLMALIDPLSGLASAILEPEVVAMTERELVQTCAMAVANRCTTPQCAQPEATLSVQLQSVRATGGTAPAPGQTKGTALTVQTDAVFTLTRNDGTPIFSQSYYGRRHGPTPTIANNGSDNFSEALISVQSAARLAQKALFAMVSAFVADLKPGETTDTLLLEEPEALKPAVKMAADGNTEGAMAQHRAYLATNPNDGRAWANVGALHSVRGEFQEALAAYERAAQLGGDERFQEEVVYARNRMSQMQYLQTLRRVACGTPMQ